MIVTHTLRSKLHGLLFPAAAVQFEILGHRLERTQDRHQALVADHGLCLDALMALVALDDNGQWSTVHHADTLLPEELQAYLHTLVARS